MEFRQKTKKKNEIGAWNNPECRVGITIDKKSRKKNCVEMCLIRCEMNKDPKSIKSHRNLLCLTRLRVAAVHKEWKCAFLDVQIAGIDDAFAANYQNEFCDLTLEWQILQKMK